MSKRKNLSGAEEKRFWQERANRNAIEVANQLYDIIAGAKLLIFRSRVELYNIQHSTPLLSSFLEKSIFLLLQRRIKEDF